MRRNPLAFLLLSLSMIIVTGCAHRSRPEQAQVTYVSRPVIDFGKGGGGLPLEGVKELHTAADLLLGLTQGYRSRVELPKDHDPITIAGEFPQLDFLQIDLSNATLKKDYKPREFRKPSVPRPVVFAKQFEYIARPLRYQNGPMEWHISARDAELDLVRDGDQSTLVLTSAAEGSFEFSMNVADVRPMLLAGAKAHSKGGFSVKDIWFEVRCENDRALVIDMKVDATWLLLPATFRLGGRVDLDEACNVRLSGLKCDGENLGGLLLAGFIDDAMQKHNGKVMPLAQWPGNKIRLSGAQIKLDDHIRIKAAFGPAPTLAKTN
ncbi:MAG TPA: hypothetical protein VGQ99_23985 [Tepidisphaeraceae bacterium]|jgi:hypothetical protein|nr:hypothetical protein [Tepidisphaeraceae bacterium]